MFTQPPSIFHINYLISELLVQAWSASVQRAKPYAKNEDASEERPQMTAFRLDLLKFVELKLLPGYVMPCSEAQHISNLHSLVEHGTSIGGDMFDERGYRLGIAQKFLNMVLKSLWAMGLIAEPPHCPIDRLISNHAPRRARIAWTKLTEMDDYMRVIGALQQVAGCHGLSLAEWELRNFSRRESMTLDAVALRRLAPKLASR